MVIGGIILIAIGAVDGHILSSSKACVVFLEIIVTAAFTDFGLDV